MIKKITIIQYRKLMNINIGFTPNVNVISGTNGTCKTSILHLITGIGKKFLKKAGGSMASYANDESMMRMVNAMLYSTPLRMMRLTGGMSWEQVDGIADMANGHYLRGIRKMKKKK